MIVKVQAARKHTSNAKRLQEYLTEERDIYEPATPSVTGNESFANLQEYLTVPRDMQAVKRTLRGDVVLSNNLADLSTAAIEMEGVAANNPRCKDAILHYELSWPHDERPTKAQWVDCGLQTLKALGYGEHQYIIVAHEDKRHFHIHLMVNKVHPETFRVNNPFQNWPTLHKTARVLEAKYGWKHTPGLARWDDERKEAVAVSKADRQRERLTNGKPTSEAAKYEHYNDTESLQTYVRKEIAPALYRLLRGNGAKWSDVHSLLARANLRMEKGESGGYTVLAIDHGIRVKASDVFRNDFAGKTNRARTEALLGEWLPPRDQREYTSAEKIEDRANPAGSPTRSAAEFHKASNRRPRDEQRREESRLRRQSEREELKFDYATYKNEQLATCRRITEEGKKQRLALSAQLKDRKKKIRAGMDTWATKKAYLSQAVAESVKAQHAAKLATLQERRAAQPKSYREWVADRAAEGDHRAAAQLRGWHYQDQRNQKKLDGRLEAGAVHLQAANSDQADSPDWVEFAQKRLAAERRQAFLEDQIARTRIWEINRRTGDVTYALNGTASIIDRGKIVTVLTHDEASIVFGLEMSIKKYGTHLACTGSAEWKAAVAQAVARNGIYVRFADPELQRMVEDHQRSSSPIQRQVNRLGAIQDRLKQCADDELTFENETDLYQLLASVQPSENAKQTLRILRESNEPNPRANFGETLTVERVVTPDRPLTYRVRIEREHFAHVVERIDRARESAQRALSENVRVRTREGLER